MKTLKETLKEMFIEKFTEMFIDKEKPCLYCEDGPPLSPEYLQKDRLLTYLCRQQLCHKKKREGNIQKRSNVSFSVVFNNFLPAGEVFLASQRESTAQNLLTARKFANPLLFCQEMELVQHRHDLCRLLGRQLVLQSVIKPDITATVGNSLSR